jgi:hypothetical protein
MRLAALALALLALVVPGRALPDGIQCDRGIVSVGDTKVDLLAKCGDPTLRDVRLEKVIVPGADGAPPTAAAVRVIESWTYDLGPNRLVRLVTIADGRVAAIEQRGYGYGLAVADAAPPVPQGDCVIRVGDIALDLLARCGAPTARDARVESRAAGGADVAAIVSVAVEVWVFDFGPNRLVQIITLQNGKVVSVEHGGYGYSR